MNRDKNDLSLIHWRHEFETGIAAVDHEHAELIALINHMHAQMRHGAQLAVAEFLSELHDSIAAHFALEEKIMRDHAFVGYRAHKEDHERLLDDIRDIMEEQAHGQFSNLTATLAPRLERWFTDHFQAMDALLHKQIGTA